MTRNDWEDRGLCAQVGGDLFFPEKGDPAREAKAICRRCDVREDCLNGALDRRERDGIWGGLGRTERDKIAKQRNRQVAA